MPFKKIESERLDLWINYLIVLLGFTLPISVAANNVILAIIFLLWIAGGNYAKKWEAVKNNRAAVAILIFLAFQIMALSYSPDIRTGLDILKKERLLLFMPIILSVIKPEFVKKAFSAFLLAMFISELIAYGLYFGLYNGLPWRSEASQYDITPFISHISYTPMLAFAAILLLHRIVNEEFSRVYKIIYFIFFLTMSFNIFISGGRAGQIAYIAILLLYIGYSFRKEYKKIVSLFLVVISGIVLMYFFNSSFHNRIHNAYEDVINFNKNPNTSVGLRINFTLNSMELIREKPIWGHGTGSFPTAYERINNKLTPKVTSTDQPHNFYIFTLVQTGIIGLLLLLYIFYSMYTLAVKIDDRHRGLRYAFLLLFLTIMLSDSYLLGHYTTLFFVFVTALLFKDKVEDV